MINNDKIAEKFSDRIEEFTERMAKKDAGDIISSDEIAEAASIIRDINKELTEMGDNALSASEATELFK